MIELAALTAIIVILLGAIGIGGLTLATRNPQLERRVKVLTADNVKLADTLSEIAAYADQGRDAVPELQAVSDIIGAHDARQLTEGNTHG
jgi:hypothetical protein